MQLKLKRLSNENLVLDLKDLVRKERELLTRLLHYLREIDRRKLYAQRGYDSLFAFMRAELGYSEASADRRIKAMRLIRDLPEVEEKIATGSLSLSVASTVQRFIYQENKKRKSSSVLPLPRETKLKWIHQLEGSSLRECEKKLAAISPESALPRDKTRNLTPEKVQITFTASTGLFQKIERFKVLTSHQNPQGQYERLFEKAVDLALEKLDPEKKKKYSANQGIGPKPLRRDKLETGDLEPSALKTESSTPLGTPRTPAPESTLGLLKRVRPKVCGQRKSGATGIGQKPGQPSKPKRYIPQVLRREVWCRDQSHCQYQDPLTGKRCLSQHQLEIDHAVPFSLGGTHTLENLRLHCRTHNQYRAEILGR